MHLSRVRTGKILTTGVLAIAGGLMIVNVATAAPQPGTFTGCLKNGIITKLRGQQ